jgi:tetratricopeptide (TPR) repeat protein
LAESLTEKVSTMISGYNSGPEVIAWFYEARAMHAGSTGDLGGRLRLAEAATESFETAGDLRNASLQRVSAGFACNELGAYDEATKNLERAFEWASRCGIENTAAIAKLQLGRAKLGGRKPAEAEKELRAAMMALDAQGNHRLGGNARSLLALTLLQRGQQVAGFEMAQEAVGMLAEIPALLPHALMSLALTELTLDTEDAASNALTTAERAVLGLSGPGSSTFGEVGILLAYAKALHRNGRNDEASIALARAVESIRNRSRAIGDRAHQRSFLDEPTNAEVRRLATAWNLEA